MPRSKARGVRHCRPQVLRKHLAAVRQLVARGGGPCAVARELKLPLSSAHTVVKAFRDEHNRSSVLHCTARGVPFGILLVPSMMMLAYTASATTQL